MTISKNGNGIKISLPFKAHWFRTIPLALGLLYLVGTGISLITFISRIEILAFLIVLTLGYLHFNIIWFRHFGFEVLEVYPNKIYFYRKGIMLFDKKRVDETMQVEIKRFIDSGLPDIGSRGDVIKGTVNGKLVLVKNNQVVGEFGSSYLTDEEVVRFGTYLTDEECELIIAEFEKIYKPLLTRD